MQKLTKTYATHGIPLECDIYTTANTPSTTPVVLFFHSGGLVGAGRDAVPPWLVQTCLERKWPLVSPSYRLLPQTGSSGLLEDAKAAYEFARVWDTTSGSPRRAIAVGASGGFFMACLVAHHCSPAPSALLSIEGINTFHHKFFNSSTLLTPEPITDDAVSQFISGPPIVGITPTARPFKFYLDKLTADGTKNTQFVAPKATPNDPQDEFHDERGLLYDYYTYKNGWLDMVGDIDPGFDWATTDDERRSKWPPTVIFHGDEDYDVALDVSKDMAKQLGDRVQLTVAPGKPHLYENTLFLEDDDSGMAAVKQSIAYLDAIMGTTQ